MGKRRRRSRGGSKEGESTRSRQPGREDDLQTSQVRERSGTNTAPAKSNLKTDHKNPEVPTHIGRENYRSKCRSKMNAADDSRLGDTQVPDSVRDVFSSPGSTLDASIQRSMEDRMDDNLGDVRVHTGPQAANACDDINARAFTVGNHVAFNSGEYDPESAEGQHVLAHELAHVRQQTGGAVSMLPQEDVGLEIDPDPALERDAEETAQRVMEGGELGIQRMADTEVHVQRWKDQPRDEVGRFDYKDKSTYPNKKYSIQHRPPYSSEQVETVWKRAKAESPDGKVRDPNSGEILAWDQAQPRGDQWHMGHKPMREYRYLLEHYLRGEISEREFVREYQNPDHYQPEAPKENMSRRHERKGQYWERKFGEREDDK